MNNRKEGVQGEQEACAYMAAMGMRILHRNYTCPLGEIDIVAQDADTLVFCEVKARATSRMGNPIEAVTPAKITQIVKTAQWYLSVNRIRTDVRFDIACVNLSSGAVVYEKSAFTQNDAGRRHHW